MKNYPIRIYTVLEDDVPVYQCILDANFCNIFQVCNMDECPEDATLQRDLFTAFDAFNFFEFLYKEVQEGGYSGIKIIDEKEFQGESEMDKYLDNLMEAKK